MGSLYLLQFSCEQVSSVATKFLAASFISGRDLNCGRDQVSSFATKFLAASLISGRDLNCGRDLFCSVVFKNLCCDLSVMSQPHCRFLLLKF